MIHSEHSIHSLTHTVLLQRLQRPSFPIGMVLGPATNLFTASLNFSIFGLPITPSNAPGLLLAVVLSLLGLAIFLLVEEPQPSSQSTDAWPRATRSKGSALREGREVEERGSPEYPLLGTRTSDDGGGDRTTQHVFSAFLQEVSRPAVLTVSLG